MYTTVQHGVLRLALVVFFLSLSFHASASSQPSRPLKRVSHPSTLALEILPRQIPPPKSLKSRSSPFLESPILYHSDSFRLTLSAFDETFHLHLRPNDHLVHPAARINYFKNGPNGQQVLDRTVPLIRENVRAYMGEVVEASHSHRRMREDAAGLLPRPAKDSGVEMGWARILVHTQGDAERGVAPVFEGAFEVRGVTYHVQTRANYLRNRKAVDPELVLTAGEPDGQMVIWRDSDMASGSESAIGGGCSHDGLEFNSDPMANSIIRKRSSITQPSWWADTLMDYAGLNNSFSRRDDVQGSGSTNNFESNIGQTTGCPTTQKVVYMGVAADCKYTAAYSSTQNATMQILNNWNTASSLYKSTFNVSLGIIQIDVQEEECPSSAPSDAPWNVDCNDTSVTLNDRLSLFSQWRGQKGDDGIGLWHLMSGCPTGTEVGVAWLGTLCQQTSSGNAGSIVSGTAVSTNGLTEWEVVSHEIGHNFGAIHDCQDGCDSTQNTTVCCPLSSSTCNANDQFIMSPVTTSSQKTFSQCSLGNICSVMQSTSSSKVNTTCLVDPDPSKHVLSLNMCGNGIVESGEDCDPGQNSTSSCCDASTCKLKNGAVCDPDSSSCCTNQCTFASAQTVCRPAADSSCDIAEMCTGSSGDCPADKFEPNGQSCGSNGLACANGVCTSLNAQCSQVGASMNLTTACQKQDTSCRVSCEDPDNANQCIQLQAPVVDGSSCGFGGTCQSGDCVPGSVLDTAKAWYVQNLQISIPVTVVASIVALFLLFGLFLCIKRCRSKTPSMEPALANRRGARIPSYDGATGAGAAGPSRSRSQRSQRSDRPAGTLPPILPFVPRPRAVQNLANVPPSHRPQNSTSSGSSTYSSGPGAGASPGSNSHSRRASIPALLRPGPSLNRGNANNNSSGGHAPPGSPRNQSWDGIVGQSTRNSGGSTSRARNPAFPSMAQVQGRPRNEDAWVDPSKWNGPMNGGPTRGARNIEDGWVDPSRWNGSR